MKQMNWRKILFPIFLSLAIVLGVFIGSRFNFSSQELRYSPAHYKLYRLLDILDKEHLEGVNTDSIVDLAAQSILSALDPHSTYIPADRYSQANEGIHGSFYGIGVRFYMYKDSIAVTEVISNGPAERAGLKNGDRIIAADGKQLIGKEVSRDSLVNTLRGISGSKVLLEVYRKSLNKSLALEVSRDRVPIQSVTASYMLQDALGYIKIEQFTEDTYKEFKKALKALERKEGIKSLILDIRDNTGGYVDQVKLIMEEVVPKGKLLYSTKDRTGEETKFYAEKGRKIDFSNVYVLINENSASASEMLAGAIQDNDLGIIVGKRSFGKGLVQVERSLGDGSAIWITIAEYYTPTGRSIQRPYGAGSKAYFAHTGEKFTESPNGEIDNIPDSLRFVTPMGKVVYGGGGIYPDVYVTEAENKQDFFMQQILKHSFIQFFAFEYTDANPDLFKGYDEEQFIEGYNTSDRLLQEFMEYSQLDTVGIQWGTYEEELSLRIKANLALQLYGKNAYSRVLSKNDPMIQTVLELELELKEEDFY